MRWYFLHLIHRKRSPFPSRGRLWQCAVCRSSDLRVQITQRSHPAFSGCFFPMTCFRRKEGIFALTAQQLGCRVPVLHRIPLFSRTRMRVSCFHSVAHLPQNKPVLSLPSKSDGCLFIYLNAAHGQSAALRWVEVRPKRNPAVFYAKYVQGEYTHFK